MDSVNENKNTGNVIGGHRANLHSPNTSVESKERSKNILEEIGSETKSSGRGSTTSTHTEATSTDTEGKNPDNVARGYKATLSNPNVSEEAKERAEHKLEEMGQH